MDDDAPLGAGWDDPGLGTDNPDTFRLKDGSFRDVGSPVGAGDAFLGVNRLSFGGAGAPDDAAAFEDSSDASFGRRGGGVSTTEDGIFERRGGGTFTC